MPDSDGLITAQRLDDAREKAIRADEKAMAAHARIDRLDKEVIAFGQKLDAVAEGISTRLGNLEISVAKVSTRIAVVSGFAAFLGAAGVAVAAHFFG